MKKSYKQRKNKEKARKKQTKIGGKGNMKRMNMNIKKNQKKERIKQE